MNVPALNGRKVSRGVALIARPLEEAPIPLRPASAPGQLRWLMDLYERHADFVRDVIAKHAGPNSDTEDLVQNVFLVAHRKWKKLVAYEQPRAWLNLAALREVWSARRRERLRRLLTFRFQPAQVELGGPEGDYEHREARRLFYALLERLSAKQRTAFILYYVDELTSAEISKMLRCPEPTVRTRLFHARRAFEAAALRWQRRATADARARDGSRP
jgi:RNA polymerase sigma-70 factor (ECF subfamily)